jgi:uncharacterized protein YbcI
MSKKIHEFNDIIRKLQKDLFEKGSERINTIFVDNMIISTLYGNLTPTEVFIASPPEGKEMIHTARTRMIQEVYQKVPPDGMEELIGAKFIHLFSDIKLEDDIGISVFLFDLQIEHKGEKADGTR